MIGMDVNLFMEYLKRKDHLDDQEWEMLCKMIEATKFQLEQLQKIYQK